jgi:predicted esterase
MHDEQQSRLVRCERHKLAYDPEKAAGCALCRSESRRPSGFPPLDRVMVGLLAAILVLLIGGVVAHVGTPLLERWLGSTDAPASPSAGNGALPVSAPRGPLRTGTFNLTTKNGIGRSGMAFIPAEAVQGPRPLLIVLHGTGGSGAGMLATFAAIARQRGVIMLAPDSGRSPDGAYNWQVPDRPNDPSPDTSHVLACLDELYATPHLKIDPARVLAVGHSGGGSTAAYLGTNDPRVRAFAVLHGGVFASGLGASVARAWFSTGTEDTLRPPDVVQRAAAAAQKHTTDVRLRFYPGGHGLTQGEIDDVISWWLDG